MQIYVVIGLFGGCLNEEHAFTDRKNALEKRDSMLKEYGLSDADKPDNQHNPDCRWNEENEVHVHTLEVS
jgi:hypothetical protein